jgi:hypothetical protein
MAFYKPISLQPFLKTAQLSVLDGSIRTVAVSDSLQFLFLSKMNSRRSGRLIFVATVAATVVALFCQSKNVVFYGSPEQMASNPIFITPPKGNESDETNAVQTVSFVSTVEPHDYIYQRRWDAAPVVVESHKLVFFTVPKVGCTVWKQLFRRMMGFQNWKSMLPHDPETNGLVYLSDYNTSRATEMMNDPTWTKALFIRDPKERLLSAYIDKATRDQGKELANICCQDGSCLSEVQHFSDFVKFSITTCKDNPHWLPQTERIDRKFLKQIQVIGHIETAELDAKRLLRRIGAWKEFGKTHWGGEGKIFHSKNTVPHATSANALDSWSRLSRYYTPALEALVENIYKEDYGYTKFNLTKRKISFGSAIQFDLENRIGL